MKAYITKYALTQGILEREVEASEEYDDMFVIKGSGFDPNTYYHKGELHNDIDYAIEKADLMRINKIKSLKKQIEKLEKLDFRKSK